METTEAIEKSIPLTHMRTLELTGYNSKIEISKLGEEYSIAFYSNLNGDYNNEVSYTANSANLKKFQGIFMKEHTFVIYDKEQDFELEIGLSAEREPTIYFAIVDFVFDATSGASPRYYATKINPSSANYQSFSELFDLISGEMLEPNESNLEKESNVYEYKLNPTQHKRTC